MAEFWLRNLTFYCLQTLLLAIAGGVCLRLLRMDAPKARLMCWQVLLVACLALPALQPWRQQIATPSNVRVTTRTIAQVQPPRNPGSAPLPTGEIVLLVLVAGAAIRMAGLALGFWRLRHYRRASTIVPGSFESLQQRMGVRAEVRVSSDVLSPVTFGLRRPVVLIPQRCLGDESVACHELLHVQRRDWLFTALEEMVLCLYWFQPAMWWLIAEIRLAREQAVDREAVFILNSRERYLESLLALAACKAGLILAPAAQFLRKRHLHKRVASLMKEVPMSRFRVSFSLATFAGALALSGWIGVRAFPLQAAPQEKMDSAGVLVQPGPLTLLHRAPVSYPKEALAKRIQGSVALELTLAGDGNVSDARVLSGPEELRKAALQSVLQWHYAADAGLPPKTQVTIDFALSNTEPQPATQIGLAVSPDASSTVKKLSIQAPDPLRQRLQSRLLVREGDTVTPGSVKDLVETAKQVDEHLNVTVQPSPDRAGSNITIALPSAPTAAAPGPPQRIRVGGNVQAANLIQKVAPVYPPLAKSARIQGTVRFTVTIGKDGKVLDIQLVSGHPLLVESAQEAVQQWVYKPTWLNGEPVEVLTQVDINYTLGDKPPDAGGAGF